MAIVRWNKRPRQLWREYLLYGLNEFGKTTAIRFVNKTNRVVAQLEKYPETGFPEPLLKGKDKVYRAYHQLPHLKIIYRFFPSSETVRIVDIWDTRRSPQTLKKRIK